MATLYLVTGHTRGLGAALVDVILADRTATAVAAAGTTEDHVVGLGRRSVGERAGLTQSIVDLADSGAAVDALLDALEIVGWRLFATVVLINNAGVLEPMRPVGSLDTAAIAEAIAVNVTTPLALTDAFLAATADGEVERRVVMLSSGAARRPYAGWATYGATKAALDHFVRAMAIETPQRCRVASVAPGVIDTDMQVAIRATSEANFPQRSRFIALHGDGQLLAPLDAARRLLAYVNSDVFATEPVVDLRDLG